MKSILKTFNLAFRNYNILLAVYFIFRVQPARSQVAIEGGRSYAERFSSVTDKWDFSPGASG